MEINAREIHFSAIFTVVNISTIINTFQFFSICTLVSKHSWRIGRELFKWKAWKGRPYFPCQSASQQTCCNYSRTSSLFFYTVQSSSIREIRYKDGYIMNEKGHLLLEFLDSQAYLEVGLLPLLAWKRMISATKNNPEKSTMRSQKSFCSYAGILKISIGSRLFQYPSRTCHDSSSFCNRLYQMLLHNLSQDSILQPEICFYHQIT